MLRLFSLETFDGKDTLDLGLEQIGKGVFLFLFFSHRSHHLHIS